MFDIFSKRQKRLRSETPDVFQYVDIPQSLRVQIVHIIRDGFGSDRAGREFKMYETINNALCREYGFFSLPCDSQRSVPSTPAGAVISFFMCVTDHEKALDVVEIAFRLVESVDENYNYEYRQYTQPALTPEEAIKELNQRFLEHGVGYQYESREIIRMDSQLIHEEVIKPALRVLTDSVYQGANAEYLSAHEHYRYGKHKECLNDCLKSFESTMKAICHKRNWTYDKDKATANKLIEICFTEGLIPTFLQTEFSALRSSLEAGIPTTRNRLSGHGQGQQSTQVPAYLAGYLLHLTATTILMLAEAEKALP